MSTSYPESIDSFAEKVDGVDTIVAAHVNNLQDAVMALEKELGVNAKGTSPSVGAALVEKLDKAGGHLSGDVTMQAGVTIDGVDISAHTHSGLPGDAPNLSIENVSGLQTALDGKISRSGDSLSGNLDMNMFKVGNLGTPGAPCDAATKGYVDTATAPLADKLDRSGGVVTGNITTTPGVQLDGVDVSDHVHSGLPGDAPNLPVSSVSGLQTTLDNKVSRTGDSLSGNLDMSSFKVLNLGAPGAPGDAATKGYVDSVTAPLADKLDRSGGVVTGSITTTPGVQLDGVDVSDHVHSGLPGDAPNLPVSSVSGLQMTLDNKVSRAGDSLNGNLNLNSFKITGLAAPFASDDAANKGYVDMATFPLANKLDTSGGHLTGNVTANPGVRIDNVDISDHTHSGMPGDAPLLPISHVSTLQGALDSKLSRMGDTLGGMLNAAGNRISGLPSPIGGDEVATKSYADSLPTLPSTSQKAALSGSGGTPGSTNRYMTENDRLVGRMAVRFRDDFLGKRADSWALSGIGGTYLHNVEIGGSGTLETGATLGNNAMLSLGGFGMTNITRNPAATIRARLNTLGQVNASVGLWCDASNQIDIFYDSSQGPNFKYRCVSGGTQTVLDSGLPADTSYHTFSIQMNTSSGTVNFSIDSGSKFSIGTNLPASALEPRLFVGTQENASKQITIDLYHLEADR